METSDEDLALAAGNGDAEAFSALLARHYDRIYRVAFRVLGSVAEAEDATQDVCMGLAAKLQSVSFVRCLLSSFLLTRLSMSCGQAVAKQHSAVSRPTGQFSIDQS